MGRGRVVLATAQPILGSIMREALASEPALEIVAEAGDLAALRRMLRQHSVDVAVVGVGRREPVAGYLDVLQEHPRLRMLLLRADGKMASACRMRLQQQELGELSLTELREVVRGLVRDTGLAGPDVHPDPSSRSLI